MRSAGLNDALREHSAAEAQLATLRQIQDSMAEDGKLAGWLDRHGLSGLPHFWEKLRIDPGWETAVEAVLRERLHAHELGAVDLVPALAADKPPAKASFYMLAAASEASTAAGQTPLARKITVSEPGLTGVVEDWLAGVYAVDGTPTHEARAALPAGSLLVNRDGHKFSRHSRELPCARCDRFGASRSAIGNRSAGRSLERSRVGARGRAERR